MKHDQCPTCGTRLGALRDHAHVRRCDACRRPNPIGFHYCGFCAAPMESDELRAEVMRAAPAGGWPSLARELVELRFFIERGDLSEAFEMVQVLRQRYPGHPELLEFTDLTPTTRPKRIHTGVNQVVDAVLAGSADWANTKLPRRPAPQWKAPSVKPEGGRTQAHTTVPAATEAGAVHKRVHAPSREERATRRGHQALARDAIIPVINPAFREAAQQEASELQVAASGLTGAVSVVSELPSKGESKPKTNTGSRKSASAKRRSTKKQKVAADGNAASGSVRARADSQRVVEKQDKTVVRPSPSPSPNTGHTVAVQTLQPAAPFAGEGDEEIDEVETLRRPVKPKDGDKRRGGKRKGAKADPQAAKRAAAERTPEDDEKREAKARRRAAKFGQNIVGR